MAKKPSKSTLTKKLDKVVSEIVRSYKKCLRCGKTETLQCCHIYSRTYRNTRWDLENVLCLCASCHFFFHKNPIEFTQFVIRHLGQEKVDKLLERRNTVKRWTVAEMQEYLDVLESYLLKL